MKSKLLSYAILGRGRWGRVIHNILSGSGRKSFISSLSIREYYNEPIKNYKKRILGELNQKSPLFDVLWIAVMPGPHQECIIECAIECNKHVICEKPLYVNTVKLEALNNKAKNKGLVIAVHLQYCFLDKLKLLSQGYNNNECSFYGSFFVKKPNSLNIDSKYNLGIHILAIYQAYFSNSRLENIDNGYGEKDLREVRLTNKSNFDVIDFTNNKELLIQKFVSSMEHSISKGKNFPINLEFYNKLVKIADQM